MLKLLPIILLLSSLAHADVYNPYYNPPHDYTIETKSAFQSSMEGWEAGQKSAMMAQESKRKRELHNAEMAKIKREDDYRAELRRFSDKPETLTNENLMKIMILYPEFNETTLKLKESLDKLNRN